ncbi:MAG: hypothetical protein JNM31_10860 [Flavobacteriales bacterium]|nr:hypothetical protein [Flavobacteriales bacterium]
MPRSYPPHRSILTALALAHALLTFTQTSFTTTAGGFRAEDGVGVLANGTGYLSGVRAFAEPLHVAALWGYSLAGGNTSQTVLPLSDRVFLQGLKEAPGGAIGFGSVFPADSSTHDMLLFKVSLTGALIWVTRPALAHDQQLLGLTVLTDGSVVACGIDNATGKHEALVARFDANGQLLWHSTAGSSLDVEAHGVAVDGSLVMVTGREVDFSGRSDAFFALFDMSGNLTWTTSWGGAADEIGRALVRTAPGKFIMAGTTSSFGPTTTTGQRKECVYMMQLDLLGDTVWTATIGDTLFHRKALAMTIATNGDLLVAGAREQDNAGDAMVLRVSTAGLMVWERIYQAGGDDRLLAIQALPVGFVATGWSNGVDSRQVLLVRRNDAGN